MNQAYVYLLRSLKDKKFYVGWTTDPIRRLDAHNKGLNRSTKARRPFEMVSYEVYPDAGLAKVRERSLKKNPNMLACFKRRMLCTSTPGANEVVG